MNTTSLQTWCLSTEVFDNISSIVDIDSNNQVITGKKIFKQTITLGDNIIDTGHNCFGVGNDLIVGQYNFFYKGIDLYPDTKTAKIYLTDKQCRYPYPFLIKNGNLNTIYVSTKPNGQTIDNYIDTVTSTNHSKYWKLTFTDSYRPDYSQLSIDCVNEYNDAKIYQTDSSIAKDLLTRYIIDAFTPQTDLSVFDLINKLNKNAQITIVNYYKDKYLRCGKVLDVLDNGSVLSVQLTNLEGFDHLNTQGITFNDFDYDDASLVFIDQPTLSGPANTSTYSSMGIGAENTILRRCSLVAGKNNKSESDFCVALGRKAEANHYCSFVWGPNSSGSIKSPKNRSFTIGVYGTLDSTYKNDTNKTFYIADYTGKSEPIHTYVNNCLINENNHTELNKLSSALSLDTMSNRITELETTIQNLTNQITELTNQINTLTNNNN